MTPTLLAFDTSTELMSLALITPTHTHLHESAGGALASQRLLPQAQALLQSAGLAWPDLDGIAFGRGPGAFSGLRTACSVAQGLALGLGKPVLPLDSLMLVAEDACESRMVWVAMDARMDEIYAAAYTRTSANAPLQTDHAPALYTVQALHAQWQAQVPAVVAGSALSVFGDRLGLPATTLQMTHTTSRAAALARLATQQWHAGQGVDAALALPLYLRNKVAQTTAERAALKSP
jgi:tRNA threonylcarbamoyladenosine biosynthesis protein TsaB